MDYFVSDLHFLTEDNLQESLRLSTESPCSALCFGWTTWYLYGALLLDLLVLKGSWFVSYGGEEFSLFFLPLTMLTYTATKDFPIHIPYTYAGILHSF